MPKLERRLLTERKSVKKEMFKMQARLAMQRGKATQEDIEKWRGWGYEIIKKGELSPKEEKILEVCCNILDAQQKALKVSANSAYGAMGAKNGFIPLIPGAASVTAMGRWLITKAIDRAIEGWPFTKLVYGDSVTGDTPILCKNQGCVHILPINKIHLLIEGGEWEKYPGFKLDAVKRTNKERMDVFGEITVWCGEPHGWQRLKRVIKHRVGKKIYRVATRNGIVDVTEDHSLIRGNGDLVKAGKLNVGDKLLTSFPSDFVEYIKKEQNAVVPIQKKCSLCGQQKNKEEEFHKMGNRRHSRCKACRKENLQKGVRNPKYFSESKYKREYVDRIPSPEEAWVWGLFMADGSCGRYEYKSGTKYSWAINNQNLKFLERAKEILERVEPFEFKILNTMKSSSVYKLVPCGYMKYITQKYRQFMYFEQQKYVHTKILNSSEETRREFFNGYRAGRQIQWGAKGKLVSQGLYYLAKSLGYKNLRIVEHTKKPDFYTVTSSKTFQRARNQVRKIYEIPPLSTEGNIVYDLETECGRFQAGIGEIIAKNTDSCMLHFEGKTLKESFEIAEEISKVVTHYLKCCILGVSEDFTVTWRDPVSRFTLDKTKKFSEEQLLKGLSEEDLIVALSYRDVPIDLEFENMYGRFLLLTKKRYIAYIVDKEGKIIGITKKGVVMARRDNCAYLRKVYEMMSKSILDKKSEVEIMGILYERIEALFTRQVKDTDLIIYVGVKDVKEYAKKRTSDEDSSDTNPFIDDKGNPFTDVSSPLDERLQYRNLPQCLLALKMLRRGDDVPPNTRLEIIYLENPNALHQGDKAEDFTYYRESKGIEGLRPDPLHYLEKQLTKPVTELITVKYPREVVPYEKLDDAINRVLKNLNQLQSNRVANTRVYTKERPIREPSSVGWECFEKEIGKKLTRELKTRPKIFPEKFESYKFKGKTAKVEYILQSAAKGGINEINPDRDAELVDICRRWKSRNILNRLYREKGVKKRPSKRPYRTGPKFPPKMKVLLTRSYKSVPRGTLCKVIDFKEEVEGEFTYNLILDEKRGQILKDVPRSHISTYLRKDETVMKDILTARVRYRQVVNHLNDLFSPVILEG